MKYSLLASLLLLGLAAQAQAPLFAPVVAYDSGGDNPYCLALADVNGDSKPDMVLANTYSSTIGVLLSNGNGTFQPAVTYSTGAGTSPRNVVVADLNGDAKPDLVFADIQGMGFVGALFGNGNGTFQAVTRFTTVPGITTDHVAVGDLNGDGKPDLVTCHFTAAGGTGTVQVLLGNGNGTFQAARTHTGGSAFGLVIGDVNRDGKPDVVTADFFGHSVGVFLGNGDGSLQAEQTYSTGPGSAPYEVAVADVNADGHPDLLTANNGSSTAGVLLGHGNGTFQPAATYSTGSNSTPTGIVAVDLNADGHLDLVTANFGSDAAAVLLGSGNGTFPAPLLFSTDTRPNQVSAPFNVVAADVNQDGRLDLLVANYGSGAGAILLQTTVLATRPVLAGAQVTLAPNPAPDRTTLQLRGLPSAVATVQATLLDATGRVAARYILPASQGAAQGEVPTATLAPGLYVVQLLALAKSGAAIAPLLAPRLNVQ